MKKSNLIYLALGAVAVYYLYQNIKKKGGLPGNINLKSEANKLATDQAKNINFVPDMTTMLDQYKNDLKNCK
jgi:hypothetical protein